EFSGWADSEVKLEFDSTRRALLAHFQLRDIHLNNTPAVLNGPLLNMVQGAIDQRYNPVELFTLKQLSTRVNIQPAGGALQLRANRAGLRAAAGRLHLYHAEVESVDHVPQGRPDSWCQRELLVDEGADQRLRVLDLADARRRQRHRVSTRPHRANIEDATDVDVAGQKQQAASRG